MSDLFHEGVPLSYIRRVFDVMNITPQHTYQLLTKRAERLGELANKLAWPCNVWMGVSVENADFWYRVDHLRKVKAQVRFLSLEPLLGPLGQIDLQGIHWVIAGGESGPKARAVDSTWVREIWDACLDQNVPFHFKQWGGANKKRAGRTLDNRIGTNYHRRHPTLLPRKPTPEAIVAPALATLVKPRPAERTWSLSGGAAMRSLTLAPRKTGPSRARRRGRRFA